MAKQRVVNTRFWSDAWVRSINPLDRYFFLYLLTNEKTNLCGIYELPIDTMAHETGIKENDLQSSFFPRMKPKMFYFKNYVILVNFAKHQNTENPKIVAGIQRELSEIPEEIYKKAIGYGYPIHRLSHLTKLNLTIPNGEEESETPIVPKAKRVRSTSEFDFNDILKEWSSGKPEYKVFAHYCKACKIKLLSQVEVDRFKKTYFKSAVIIKEYSPERAEKVFGILTEKKGSDWSLWNVASEISNKKYE